MKPQKIFAPVLAALLLSAPVVSGFAAAQQSASGMVLMTPGESSMMTDAAPILSPQDCFGPDLEFMASEGKFRAHLLTLPLERQDACAAMWDNRQAAIAEYNATPRYRGGKDE